MPRSLRLLPLLAAACGPTLPETTATDSTAATATTSDNTTMSEGTGTSEPPTTGATTTTTTSTTGEPATTTIGITTLEETTGGPACEDADPETVTAQWSLDFISHPPQASLSAACTVLQIDEPAPGSAEIGMACQQDEAMILSLKYTRAPVRPPPLFVGQEIVLEYREEMVFWHSRWFSIRDVGNPALMKFGGIGADRIEPPGATVEDFYATALEVVGGVCEPFDDGPCGLAERLALAVPFGFPSPVFDGRFDEVINLPGHYDLWLAEARRPVGPIACDEVPPAWFQALMVLVVSP